MSKIVVLSKFGFKLDSAKSDWVSVDKPLLNREPFLSLKKGMLIDVISKNPKGFVTDFKILSPSVFDGCGVNDIRASDRDRHILKGQCLNIAFNFLLGQDLGVQEVRDRGIRLAQKLFVELESADYYKW